MRAAQGLETGRWPFLTVHCACPVGLCRSDLVLSRVCDTGGPGWDPVPGWVSDGRAEPSTVHKHFPETGDKEWLVPFLCGRWEWLHQWLPHGALPAWRQALWDRGGHQRGAQAHHRQGLQRHLQVTLPVQGQHRDHHEALTMRLERTTWLLPACHPSIVTCGVPSACSGNRCCWTELRQNEWEGTWKEKCFFSFVIILNHGVHELLIVSFARQKFFPLPGWHGVCCHSYTQKVNPKPLKWTMREQLCSFQKAQSAIKQLEFSILPLEGETSCCDLPVGLLSSMLGTWHQPHCGVAIINT